jgi:hypothetical protein
MTANRKIIIPGFIGVITYKKKNARIKKKAFSIGSLDDFYEEKKYWLTKKPYERLQAIEINRRMIYGENRTASRLQRFLETSSADFSVK